MAAVVIWNSFWYNMFVAVLVKNCKAGEGFRTEEERRVTKRITGNQGNDQLFSAKHVNIEIIRSKRKTLAIQICSDGRILARAPRRMKDAEIMNFVGEKSGWISKNLEKMREQREKMEQEPPVPQLSKQELHALADQALEILPERVRYYARQIGVDYGRITIRNQKTRWGSCSGKGNLNFNCLLMLAPAEIQDYVVVHELCHRKEMNHSPRFWAEVAKIMPDYQERRKWLKDHGQEIMRRMLGA